MEELSSLGEFSRRAADLIAAAAAEAVAARGRFTLALTGGNTVQPVYLRLAAGADGEPRRLLREATDYFWGDERLVLPDHPDSNSGMARRLFLDELAVPAARLHPMVTSLADPAAVAPAYGRELRDYFCPALSPKGWPVFDLILLGLGPDGHVASLFPGSGVLAEQEQWVSRVPSPGLPPLVARLTLTLPVLNQARLVVVLVSGEERIKLARRISGGDPALDALPAARLRPAGRLVWLLNLDLEPHG